MYSNIKLVTLINSGKDYVMNQVKHTPLDKALVSASETTMLSTHHIWEHRLTLFAKHTIVQNTSKA